MSGYDRLPISTRDTVNRFSNSFNLRPRTLVTLFKIIIPAAFLLGLLGFYRYEPHIELAFYDRDFVSSHIERVEPLSSRCWDPALVSTAYNLSEGLYGLRRTEVHAGLPLRMGLDCYNLAGTIQSRPEDAERRNEWWGDAGQEERVQFHTYWRADLAPFGPRQEWMLKSFFTTQPLETSRLILWSNGDLHQNPILQKYLKRYPQSFALRIVDIPALARGTEMEGSALLESKDAKAWVDGDLIRLLLLWNYGGVWIDMDSLFTRNLEPLLEHEFVTQWDCYDKIYQPFNGALMRFRKHSPYLCEAFHIMATDPPPRSGSTDWGSLLYYKLWRRLVHAQVPPFKVLPYCFSEGRSCRLDNRLPDPFSEDNSKGLWTMGLDLKEGGGLDRTLKSVFAVHLHNQWEKGFPEGGWVERLLLRRIEERLGG